MLQALWAKAWGEVLGMEGGAGDWEKGWGRLIILCLGDS